MFTTKEKLEIMVLEGYQLVIKRSPWLIAGAVLGIGTLWFVVKVGLGA